jgi:hypothetical protein
VQQPTTELAAALAAGRAAADAIAFLGDPQSFAAGAVIDKGAAGPATVADIASQVAATITLRAMLGQSVRIVAEESLEEVESLGGDSLLATVSAAVRAAGRTREGRFRVSEGRVRCCGSERAREALRREPPLRVRRRWRRAEQQ